MYKVTCQYGGQTYTLSDPLSDELKIYDDELTTADNEPGNFTFTVSADHPYIDKIVGMESEIRVYDDEEEIWRGRPIDDGEDIYRAKTFTCEGELAFLFDSIQPRRELHDITPLQFFTLLLDEHNAQMKNKGPIDKTFEVGIVTVTDPNNSLYRYTNRETTLDDIRDKIIDRLGGHLSVRVENGKRYLDLLADVETVSDQPIQLGENLLEYAADTDYTEIATACIPLGEALEESEIDKLDAYLTIESVNDGKDYLELNDAVQRYGRICKVVHFDNYTDAGRLKTAGQKWLTDGQYAQLTLELSAIDLHALGYDVQPIRVRRKVRVISEPHGMDRYFEVTERTYHLTKPESDTVTLGASMRKKSYTSSSNSTLTATRDDIKQSASAEKAAVWNQFETERKNVSNMLNTATHGYVVLDPNNGPERILIMDTNNVNTATKLWKWDLNGLGYSNKGINGPWGTAITMDGHIVADFLYGGTIRGVNMNIGNGVFTIDGETGAVVAKNLTVTGGKVNLTGANAKDSLISLSYGNYSSACTPSLVQVQNKSTGELAVVDAHAMTVSNNDESAQYHHGGMSFTAGKHYAYLTKSTDGGYVLSLGKDNTSNAYIDGEKGYGNFKSYLAASDFITSSSRATKKNIKDMGDVMDKIKAFRPVTFNYKTDSENAPLRYGLIAEEAVDVAPEIVSSGPMVGIDYSKLTPYLLKAMQTIIGRVEALEKKSA